MKLITTLIACAIPAAAAGYSLGSFPPNAIRIASTPSRTSLYGLSRRLAFPWVSPYSMMDMQWRDVERFRQATNKAIENAFQNYSPGYQMLDNDEKFQVTVEVPGVKPENLSIKVEEDGKVLTVSGSREKTSNGYSYSSQFSQSFYLDPTVDSEKISASLENGILTVTAPKDLKKIEEEAKTIPITVIGEQPRQILSDTTTANVELAKEGATASSPDVEISQEQPV